MFPGNGPLSGETLASVFQAGLRTPAAEDSFQQRSYFPLHNGAVQQHMYPLELLSPRKVNSFSSALPLNRLF